ncbi:MAG: demethoxyubiquinone hydroxylase family protein, partial [Pseudomonadota bacterium]
IRPCAAAFLWRIGGSLLGLFTALLGRNAILVCTASVEETVHRHLKEQIAFLYGKDDVLKDIIEKIKIEEDKHLEFAKNNMKDNIINKPLDKIISAVTEAIIWLSTWGES